MNLSLDGYAAAYRHSPDPTMQRIVARAQHNIANRFMCDGDMVAANKAWDDLVADYGDVAVDALQEDLARFEETLGRPADVNEVGAMALTTGRILARCAPDRVASVIDPALAELRAAPSTDIRDALIAQLEKLGVEHNEN